METRRERPDGTAEVDMNDCLKSSLRMRPDRIIVGEVRGSECATLLTAMNTGHDGSFRKPARKLRPRNHYEDDKSSNGCASIMLTGLT